MFISISVVTLTFNLHLQTRLNEGPNMSSLLILPCEFGANPFSGFRDISYMHKQKTQTDGAKK